MAKLRTEGFFESQPLRVKMFVCNFLTWSSYCIIRNDCTCVSGFFKINLKKSNGLSYYLCLTHTKKQVRASSLYKKLACCVPLLGKCLPLVHPIFAVMRQFDQRHVSRSSRLFLGLPQPPARCLRAPRLSQRLEI